MYTPFPIRVNLFDSLTGSSSRCGYMLIMVHIHQESIVSAPQGFVFDYLGDMRNAGEWLFGIDRLEITGDLEHGLGTVYDGSVKLGPKTLHSHVKVVRWEPPSIVGFESVRGFVNRSTWTTRAVDATTTEIIVDLTYELPGGLAGRILGQVIEPFVALAVRHSDETLRNKLEARYRDAA